MPGQRKICRKGSVQSGANLARVVNISFNLIEKKEKENDDAERTEKDA
jgi:hypothetical protein